MQLLQQLREGGLIAIAGQPDTPNVEFKNNSKKYSLNLHHQSLL